MKIPVVFVNGLQGTISIKDLNELLEKKLIEGIYRSSGWALASRGELRINRADDTHSWRDRKCNRLLLTM
jgi:hypothetical protein